MYKILLFDDRPQIRLALEDKLEAKEMQIFGCKSIYEAKDVWNKKKSELDAIVLDMMMPSLGLDETLRPLTKGGLLTGWIWLWHFLNPDSKTPHPAADKCIVIYSTYLEDFDAYINSSEASNAEKEFVQYVKRIPKGNGDIGENVIKYLIQDLNQKANGVLATKST